jgi:ribosome biogenesis GTPase
MTQIIAANIDEAFIVQSLDRDYSLNRFERYMAIAGTGKIKPVIILNKTDLVPEEELESAISEIRSRFDDIKVFATSAVTGKGMSELTAHMKKGTTYCLLGSSGVGKSSLINRLLGKEVIKTAEISPQTQRGKHITTRRELFVLEDGGLLIDNPGLREIGMIDSAAGIDSVFSEISGIAGKCRFSNCTHQHEPDCAVIAAVNSGELDEKKYLNYIKLVKENEYYSMTKLEKRKKDRKFGKMVKQVMKHKKRFKE